MFLPQIEFILYVADQAASTHFYSQLLLREPVLQVPGMTEFMLAPHCKLGLMPNNSIAKILVDRLPHPETGSGIPRCELYLYVEDALAAYEHALACGALPVSQVADRDWGDRVGYVADHDGHIIALAMRI